METRKWAHAPKEVKKFRNDPNFIESGEDDNGNTIFRDTRIEIVLSKREKQVYDMKEQSDEEIAKALEISAKSVESYRNKIKLKGF